MENKLLNGNVGISSKSARKLFHFTLFHLPLLTGLLLINKKHWQSEDKTAAHTLSHYRMFLKCYICMFRLFCLQYNYT